MPPEGINPAEFPDDLAQVWDWFLALHRARRRSDMGAPMPISYEGLQAYFAFRRIRPQEWEVDLIMQLDGVALSGDGEKNVG